MPDTTGRCRQHERRRKTHNAHTIAAGVTGIVLFLLGYAADTPAAIIAGYGALFIVAGYLATTAQDRLDALHDAVTNCPDCRDLKVHDLDD